LTRLQAEAINIRQVERELQTNTRIEIRTVDRWVGVAGVGVVLGPGVGLNVADVLVGSGSMISPSPPEGGGVVAAPEPPGGGCS